VSPRSILPFACHQVEQLDPYGHAKQSALVIAVALLRKFMTKLSHVLTLAREFKGAVESFVCVHAGTYSIHSGRNRAEDVGCGQ
jgi:hypothetical protein